MSDEDRIVVQALLRSVRPALWSTATREVCEFEVERRIALERGQPSHLPLYAEPMSYIGLTAEEAESEAIRNLREAEKMLREVSDLEVHDRILERFQSHVRFMRLQTAECEFRKAKPLPQLILIDGAHRWHVAASRNEEKIYISLSQSGARQLASHEDFIGVVQAGISPGHPVKSYSSTLTKTALSNKATELGAYMNYVSHVSSPMTFADRVFLLQSWYHGAIQSIRRPGTRTLLQDFLNHKNVLFLLSLSIRRYRDGALLKSLKFKRVSCWADDGERTVKKLKSEVFFVEIEESAGQNEPYLHLPPPMVLVVAATSENPAESLLRSPEFVVQCAMKTVSSPVSRILMGHALRSKHEPVIVNLISDVNTNEESYSTSGALQKKDAFQFSLRMNSFEVLSKGYTVPKGIETRVVDRLGPQGSVTAMDLSLILASAVSHIPVEDLRFQEAFPNVSRRKYSRIWEYHLPDRYMLLRSIIKVSLEAWLAGVPLKKVCEKAASIRIEVGNARFAIGQTVGLKIDSRDLSFLLRAGSQGVFRQVKTADKSVKTVDGHSTKCFLLQVQNASVEVDKDALEAAPEPLERAAECSCDFYTDTAAKTGMALNGAFFLSPLPLSDLYRGKKPSYTESPSSGVTLATSRSKKISPTQLEEQMSNFKNDKQAEHVKALADKTDRVISNLEAERISHAELAKYEDSLDLFMRRIRFLDLVRDMLDSLHDLASEIGLVHYGILEEKFQKCCTKLQVAEGTWQGHEDVPGLEKALVNYSPVGIERYYKAAATLARPKTGNTETCTDLQEAMVLWRKRVWVHEQGRNAMIVAEKKERAENNNQRRLAAKVSRASRNDVLGASTHSGAAATRRIKKKSTFSTARMRAQPQHNLPQAEKELPSRRGSSADVTYCDPNNPRLAAKVSEASRKDVEDASQGDEAATRRSKRKSIFSTARSHARPQHDRRQAEEELPTADATYGDPKKPRLQDREGADKSAAQSMPENTGKGSHLLLDAAAAAAPTLRLKTSDSGTASRSQIARERLAATAGASAAKTLVFDDINAHRISNRIHRAAMHRVEHVSNALPSTMASGSNTKWFVTEKQLHSIRNECATRQLTLTRDQNADASTPGSVKQVVYDLNNVGFGSIVGAFKTSGALLDIDTVIDTPCTELKLMPGQPGDDLQIDVGSSFLPIPNPGGGRSQTSNLYWAEKEKALTSRDEQLARAAHRHLARVCAIVEDIMAWDIVDGVVAECPGEPEVEHKCPNTGGRVLVTHPPASSDFKENDDSLPQGGLPQRPHIDFATPVRAVPPTVGTLPSRNRNTPMFVLCTGRVAAALRVYPASHRWSSCIGSIHNFLVKTAQVELVHVPPYSFLIVRGDCYHAGAGWLESKWLNDASGVVNKKDPNFLKGIARWHIYFTTRSTSVTNAIHFAQDDQDTVFSDTHLQIMPTINGMIWEETLEDFSFKMRRQSSEIP